MEEISEVLGETSQAKSKKRSVPGSKAREDGQSLRCLGSSETVGDETGVVGSWKITGDFYRRLKYRILVWRF